MRSEERRSWRSGLVGLVCCVYQAGELGFLLRGAGEAHRDFKH